ncbi:hypothetical protein [Limnoglobus roseus]|uniref:Uncharacterized protein n=1 Tax=Limnoglobus roseus TaxID=2598579 RepID=A0A5C1ANI3_9BACT|nr:hypothetical protein [Limnoglobus roseus]QEL19566.1 hypothetical protein PX52LOC_06642 [Limnoglobus roseus]
MATSSPDDLNRLNRGFILANQANNQRNLDNFGVDDRRAIVDALRTAGGATLTGFNGAPRADDLLKKMLSNSFGGAFKLNPGQDAEEKRLQDVIADRFKTAETAVQGLIKFQEKTTADYFKAQAQQQNEFFNRLGGFFAQQKIGDK